MPGLFDDIAEWLNSGATVRTRLAKTQGPSGLFHAVANPEAVMNSDPANAASGFLGPMGAVGLGGIMTYHGTPHKFDKFDLSKIGSGEGAQVYGRGMYFAENPKTAQAYRTALGGTEVGGVNTRTAIGPEKSAANWVDYQVGGGSDDPLKTALAGAMQSGESPEVVAILRKWNQEQAPVKAGGSVLKQDLPDEVLPSLLHYDKPLREQSEGVRAAMNKSFADAGIPNAGSMMPDGQSALAWITSAMGKGQKVGDKVMQQRAAELLRANGIPGVSYFDQGSRSAGKGTLNHVVWDQDLLNRMIPQVVE